MTKRNPSNRIQEKTDPRMESLTINSLRTGIRKNSHRQTPKVSRTKASQSRHLRIRLKILMPVKSNHKTDLKPSDQQVINSNRKRALAKRNRSSKIKLFQLAS